MTLYKEFADTKAIAVIPLSNWGGLEILAINDDQLLACFNFGTGRQQIRWHNVHYPESGRAFIRKQGVRYYLDQMIHS